MASSRLNEADSPAGASCDLKIASALCENAINPIGIERVEPRLSWQLVSSLRNQYQSAWQVQVASSSQLLHSGAADLWDSGKISGPVGAQSISVPYGGSPLRSRQRCYWQVRVWDSNDRPSAFCTPQHWEMGLLQPGDWEAQWVGYPAGWTGRALYFRHTFELKNKPAKARAYIAGLGYHELRFNGKKVGDHVLDPGWTDSSKRVLYVTHDVDSFVQSGTNIVGVIVGHGWHGSVILKLQIEVTYIDGSREIIATRGGHSGAPHLWYVTGGPILSNSIYDGETYDARLEQKGWDAAVTSGMEEREEMWDTVVPLGAPGGKLVAQTNEPIRIVETLAPIAVNEARPGIYVYDAGRNLAGWALIRIQGKRGTRLTLKFAENLYEDGTVDQRALRKAAATDVYILKGEGIEEWEPRFTYHGFRYVQVEGLPGIPAPDFLRIRVIRSAVQPNGRFTCSNDLINRIQTAVVNTEASNLHSVPTDCPQRNERMGWLNDMTVRAEQALYNFRLDRFYAKWLEDIADTQAPDGTITDTAPFKWGKRPADPVSICYLLIPWLCGAHYQDLDLIRCHYAGFERWSEYLLSRADDYILSYSSWGDWAPPKGFAVQGSDGGSAIASGTPGELVSTGYLYYHAELLSRMSLFLDKRRDAARWREVADSVKIAFNRRFWNETTGGYGSNNQACNALALHLKMASPERVPRVVQNLVVDIAKQDFHLTTGNLCTKYLLEVLTENGQVDVAYRLATQTTYPSWGYMLGKGATTLWERWEHLVGASMNSHNHPMTGSVSSWFYKYLAGIQFELDETGRSQLVINPYLPTNLNWAQASYQSPQGLVESAWGRESNQLTVRIVVPVNMSATLHLPEREPGVIREGESAAEKTIGIQRLAVCGAKTVFRVGSGTYHFVVPNL